MAQAQKVSITGDTPGWFQAFGADLNKRLDFLQQQVSRQDEQITTLQGQVATLQQQVEDLTP